MIQAIRTGWVHPTINLDDPESEVVRTSPLQFWIYVIVSPSDGVWVLPIAGGDSVSYVQSLNISPICRGVYM